VRRGKRPFSALRGSPRGEQHLPAGIPTLLKMLLRYPLASRFVCLLLHNCSE